MRRVVVLHPAKLADMLYKYQIIKLMMQMLFSSKTRPQQFMSKACNTQANCF